jgi:hypothetical protein
MGEGNAADLDWVRRLLGAIASTPNWALGVIDYGHAPRLRTTALLILLGIGLAGASLLLGIADLTCDASHGRCTTPKQVGYLKAPNWSLTSLVIWPAMFYALRSLLRAADGAFRAIDGSPMTWLAEGDEAVGTTWARNKIYLRRVATVALVVALAVSVQEWWVDSRAHLLLIAEASPAEKDWSAVRTGGGMKNQFHLAFTLAAFLYQALALAVMATFASAVILMARTVAVHGSGEARPALLIDIESNDPAKRGGFERFVIVIDYTILFVFLAFVNFFLTRVQNAYLRDAAAGSLVEFIKKDFVIRDIGSIDTLFRAGSADYSSTAVAIGAVLALFQCFFFFNASLRHAALQARNRADGHLVRSPLAEKAAQTGLDTDKVRERLRDANVWPLGYSDLMPTLSFLTICGITIIFYRIGIYLVFLWIAGWILARAAQGFIRRS